MTYSILHSTRSLELFLSAIAVLGVVLAWIAPEFATRYFRSAALVFRTLARNRPFAIVAATLLPMTVRLLLLPALAFPQPHIHDEFSHLLLGDTLAHGRLANSTPPYWQHFETEYELVRPTYASQYQPGQGLVLAAGQVLGGHPWWGVWLSIGIMCGALCWGLGSILPARWALFGSMIAALQFGIYGFWMNSYFGGAMPAIGGALVFGSVARARSVSRSISSSVICATGLVILLATRPVEGLLWFAIAGWMEWRTVVKAVSIRPLVVFAVILAAGIGALAYYDARVTGNPRELPYVRYRRDYGTPQSYWWQPAVVVTRFDNAELAANYQDQLHYWERRYSAPLLWNATWRRLRDFWRFFIGPFLTPTLFFIGLLKRRARLRPWLWASGLFVIDHATYHAWYPQQSASETVLIVLLLVECWRHLRAWRRETALGLRISRQLLAGFALSIVLLGFGAVFTSVSPRFGAGPGGILAGIVSDPSGRDLVIRQLAQVPGKHLIFVYYGPKHHWYDEWVFNGADIPGSRIVFARMCSPESDRGLALAMKDRNLWIADPDADPPLTRIKAADFEVAVR